MNVEAVGSGWYAVVAACLLLVSVLAGCSPSTKVLHLQGVEGSASWHVVVVDPPSTLEPAVLQPAVSQVLRHTVGIVATWEASSELSRFNQYQGTDWFAVSPELAALAALGLRLSAESGGAYDVTVGPLLKLWGFGGQAAPARVPDAVAIEQARQRVGYHHLQVRLEPPALRKGIPDLAVELASLADGFAADQVGEYLERQGIRHYMVEVAGEIRARGNNPAGQPWRIAIEKPLPGQQRVVQEGILLRDAAVATSGDYRQFFERDGKRYSHALDSTTGYPVTHRLAAVTVVAGQAVLADAYATLLMVLGEEKGRLFAEQHGLAAYFIWREGDGLVTYMTPHFQAYIYR